MSARSGIIAARQAIQALLSGGACGAFINGTFYALHPRQGVMRVAVDSGVTERELAEEWFTWQRQGGGLRATPLDRESVRVE